MTREDFYMGHYDGCLVNPIVDKIFNAFEPKILELETANTDLQCKIISFENRTCGNCLYKIGCQILEEFSNEQKVLCFQRGWSCSEWEQR